MKKIARLLKRFSITIVAVGLLFVASEQASAQLNTKSAVVLDFDVTPGYDPIIGRKAADALAVEIERQNQFKTVAAQKVSTVPRQRLEEVIDNEPGLIAPFTEVVQSRLGQILGADRVYSGRVLNILVEDRKSARVALEVRELDVISGTYFNGAVVSQEAISIGLNDDNDLLIDQAVNKAVYSALVAIDSKPLPLGTVQNVTIKELYLNIGTRNGVLRGQRYVVIRPVYRGKDSEAKDVVNSTQVAHVVITKAEMDQSVAVVVSGGGAGVKTGDKVHLVYHPVIVSGNDPDLTRTKKKYLTRDEAEALMAVQQSRRMQHEAQEREKAARDAEKRAREYQKRALGR